MISTSNGNISSLQYFTMAIDVLFKLKLKVLFFVTCRLLSVPSTPIWHQEKRLLWILRLKFARWNPSKTRTLRRWSLMESAARMRGISGQYQLSLRCPTEWLTSLQCSPTRNSSWWAVCQKINNFRGKTFVWNDCILVIYLRKVVILLLLNHDTFPTADIVRFIHLQNDTQFQILQKWKLFGLL